MFYWITIVLSQALGSVVGEWMESAQNGLRMGHVGGSLVIAVWLAVTVTFYFWSSFSRALLFWSAFILTCPLSASFSVFLDKPHVVVGFATNQYVVSALLAFLVLLAVTVVPKWVEELRFALEFFFRAEFDHSGNLPKIPE